MDTLGENQVNTTIFSYGLRVIKYLFSPNKLNTNKSDMFFIPRSSTKSTTEILRKWVPPPPFSQSHPSSVPLSPSFSLSYSTVWKTLFVERTLNSHSWLSEGTLTVGSVSTSRHFGHFVVRLYYNFPVPESEKRNKGSKTI